MEARYREAGHQRHAHWAFLGSCAGMYVNWNIWTVLAAHVGREMQGLAGSGLEFGVIAAFIGMIVPRLKERPAAISALVAGTVAIAGVWLPYNLGLTLAAILGVAAGAVAEGGEERPRGHEQCGHHRRHGADQPRDPLPAVHAGAARSHARDCRRGLSHADRGSDRFVLPAACISIRA
jgi:hypothetical protein